MIRTVHTGILAFLVNMVALPGAAAERQGSIPISGRITYISNTSVYANIGSTDGVRSGQALYVRARGKAVAELQISALSEHWSACRLVYRTGKIRPGDAVVGWMEKTPDKKNGVTASEKPASALSPDEIAGMWKKVLEGKGILRRVEASDIEPAVPHPRISGEISVRYFRTDEASGMYDFSQPSFCTRIDAEQIGGAGLDFSVYVRGRHDIGRNLSARPGASSRPMLRFYELALTSRHRQNRLACSVGRLYPDGLNMIGTFDGLHVRYRLNKHVHTGLFGGLSPRPRDSAFQGKDPRLGAFVIYEQRGTAGVYHRSAVALVRDYAGAGKRHDLYTQSRLAFSGMYFYQMSEFRVGRTKGGESVQLASTYLSVACTPVPALSLTVSYDAWKHFPEIASYTSAADSLMEDALRHGLRVSFQIRSGKGLRLYGGASVRTQSGRHDRTLVGTFGAGLRSLGYTGVRVDVRYTGLEGPAVSARQLNVAAGRGLGRQIYLSGHFERYRYLFAGGSRLSVRYTADFGLNYWMSHSVYLHLNRQEVWGDGFRTSHSFFEMGVRF